MAAAARMCTRPSPFGFYYVGSVVKTQSGS